MKINKIANSSLSAITDEKGDLLFDRNKPRRKYTRSSRNNTPSLGSSSSGNGGAILSLFKLIIFLGAIVLLFGIITGRFKIDTFLDGVFFSARQLLSWQYSGSRSDSPDGQLSVSSQKDLVQRQPENEEGVEVGNIAPDFTLYNLSGAEVKLSDYRGTVVLLEFWASWCPPCNAAVPKLASLKERYNDKGFIILAVSVEDGMNVTEKLSQLVDKHGINYPVLLHNDDVTRAYKIRNIPTTFIIDKQGRIANKFIGLDENSYDNTIPNQIDSLLGG